MPPILQSSIIEIESSPEPNPKARVRNLGKGKAREKRSKALMGPVIEIMDSDSDVEAEFQVRGRKESTPVAGPSNSQKRKTTPANGPLFLRLDEDEGDVLMEDAFDPVRNPPVELPQDEMPSQQDVPPPVPVPQEPVDPIDQTLVQILEVIPDIDPEHALGLVQEHLPAFGALDDDGDAAMWKERTNRAAEHVIGLVFEAGAYPKAKDKKGKGKARVTKDPERENKRPKIDYTSVERVFTGGKNYFELALVSFFFLFSHLSTERLTPTPSLPSLFRFTFRLRFDAFQKPTYAACYSNTTVSMSLPISL
jgi:hypothetical protein